MLHRCMGCMTPRTDGSPLCPHCGYVHGTVQKEAYHLTPEMVLQGRYIVGKVLGYGGFGVTYMGFDGHLERIVAIKEFLPTTFATRLPGDNALTVYNTQNAQSQFSTGIKRFLEEAQTLAQFNGIKGIVDIYDTFAANNTAYIIMEFLKGQDVKHVLNNQGVMDYEFARGIILSACDTLSAVHAKNIIHRDISPDNIYLTDSGEIKLLDFGAARYESAVNSKSLSVILKSGYAPEEQYRSKGEQGPWTDVYALAATFYKMITGQTPPDSMERAIDDQLKEPSKLGVALPQSGEIAILNALGIRKLNRTQNAQELKQALEADSVQRIVVKKTKEQRGVSLSAKITIGICTALLLAFGLFVAGGGLEIDTETGEVIVDSNTITVGGTMLEDTYGSAVQEGYVLVPTLTGMGYEEATEALAELGLTLTVQGFERSYVDVGTQNEAYRYQTKEEAIQMVMDDYLTEDFTVCAQSIHGGTQMEAGGEIPITLSIWNYEEAAELGFIEDVTMMETAQAISYLHNTLGPYHNMDFIYQYSDTVPPGDIIGWDMVFSGDGWYTGSRDFDLAISIGPETSLSQYGIKLAFLYDRGIEYAVVFPYSEDNHDTYVYVSTDNKASWTELGYERSSYYTGGERVNGYTLDFANFIRLAQPQYANQELYFMIELRTEEGTVIDSLILDQSYSFTLYDPETASLNFSYVTSATKLSTQEMKNILETTTLNNQSELEFYLNQGDAVFYELHGSFGTGDWIAMADRNSMYTDTWNPIYTPSSTDWMHQVAYMRTDITDDLGGLAGESAGLAMAYDSKDTADAFSYYTPEGNINDVLIQSTIIN